MLMWWPSVISVITLHVDMVAVRILRRIDDRTNGVRNLRPCWYGVNQSDPTNRVRRSSVSLVVTCTDVVAVRNLRRTDVVAVCDSCYIILYHSMLMW